jgi:transcriptional regulator with XRE-family HTH domain
MPTSLGLRGCFLTDPSRPDFLHRLPRDAPDLGRAPQEDPPRPGHPAEAAARRLGCRPGTRAAREGEGLSQAALASELGVDESTLRGWEKGEHRPGTRAHCAAAAALLSPLSLKPQDAPPRSVERPSAPLGALRRPEEPPPPRASARSRALPGAGEARGRCPQVPAMAAQARAAPGAQSRVPPVDR